MTHSHEREDFPADQDIGAETSPDEQLAELQASLDASLVIRGELVEKIGRLERDCDIKVERSLDKSLSELVEVMDHLHAGIAVAHGKDQEGLELILNLMQGAFARQGVVPMECKGKVFDPILHHALREEDGPKGLITTVLQEGYMRNNKVLRVALVGVGSGTTSDSD